MSLVEAGALTLMLCGAAFFVTGTVGILRFPDVWTRLHAVTKADNLGLGLVSFGLMLLAGSPAVALKLLLIWLLAMLAASFSSQLIARSELRAKESSE